MINGLPDRLRILRHKYHFSQKQVADFLGISPSIVSGYEQGVRTPSVEVILSFSYLYKCTTDYLLGKESEVPDVVLDASNLKDEQIQALQTLIGTMKG